MTESREPLSPAAQKVGWGILAALLIIVGLGLYAARQRQHAADARVQASSLAGENRQLVKDALAATLQATQARAERDKASLEVQRLSKALEAAQRPPKPLPAPEGDPELAKGLETAGLKVGLVLFRGEGPSRLERQDALKVWDWNAQALRVPALELRLDAAENLVDGQIKETGALKVEVKEWASASEHWQAAHGAKAQQADALQAEVTALHKAATADKWKTRAEVVGVAVLSYLVGRRL